MRLKLWQLIVLIFFYFGIGVYSYIDLTEFERYGGERTMWAPLAAIYNAVGKWGVVAVWVGFGCLLAVGLFKFLRLQKQIDAQVERLERGPDARESRPRRPSRQRPRPSRTEPRPSRTRAAAPRPIGKSEDGGVAAPPQGPPNAVQKALAETPPSEDESIAPANSDDRGPRFLR